MTTAVTGAAGLLGANLVRALLDDGQTVRALVRKDTRALDGLDVSIQQIDVLRPETLPPALAGVETVFHLAADVTLTASDPQGAIRKTNVEGTQNVVDACRKAGVHRLVHFSSIHALAPTQDGAELDERAPLATSKTAMAYDETKADAERAILLAVENGLDAVIVNPTAVIGPYDTKPSALGRVLQRLYAGEMPALVRAGFDWVDARDVALGAIAASKIGQRGARYILGGHWRSFVELADLVGRYGGASPPRLALPLWLAYVGVPFVRGWSAVRGTTPMYTRTMLDTVCGHARVSCHRARTELGYLPRPFEETIREAVMWFSENQTAARR